MSSYPTAPPGFPLAPGSFVGNGDPYCTGCVPSPAPNTGYLPGFPLPNGVQGCFPTPFYPSNQPSTDCMPQYAASPNTGPYPANLPQGGLYQTTGYQAYAYNYLPQGAYIISTFSSSYQYNLPQSTMFCFPFKLTGDMQQVAISVALTTPFENVFIPGVKSWASAEPAGTSITAVPLQSQQTLSLGPQGAVWNFWNIAQQGQIELAPSNINSWINSGQLYWFNVQNIQNRPNSFYCRFNFLGPNINILV